MSLLASRESLFMSPVMSFLSKATEKLKEILLFIFFVLLGKVLMIYESNRLNNISDYGTSIIIFNLNAKSVRLYTCPSLILGRRKPLVDDEQIESHAESYIAPKKCAVEVCPLGTLRGLIIQPTRDIFSAMPLTTNLNFLRSESSMSKALMTPYVCLQTHLLRMRCKVTKINKNKDIMCYRF